MYMTHTARTHTHRRMDQDNKLLCRTKPNRKHVPVYSIYLVNTGLSDELVIYLEDEYTPPTANSLR